MHNNAQSGNHHHKRETRRQHAPRLANKRKHFAHLAGSKIASHSVSTRIAVRAQRHARNNLKNDQHCMAALGNRFVSNGRFHLQRRYPLNKKPSEGAEMPESATANATTAESQVVIPEVLPMEGEATFAKKAKGIAQVAAGSALTAAGIPMLVLPGPGVAAIVGGAALVSRGNRNYTGRTATPLEKRLDEAASKAADLAADTAKRTAGKAGEKAKDAALKTGAIARETAEMAATSAPEVAKGFTRGATTAAHVASAAAKKRCPRSKAPVRKREEGYRGGHLISKARRARRRKEKQVTWAPAKSCRRQCRRVESGG